MQEKQEGQILLWPSFHARTHARLRFLPECFLYVSIFLMEAGKMANIAP